MATISRLWLVFGYLLCAGGMALAKDPSTVPWTLPELFTRVPPLTHDALGRLPLIVIEPFRLTPEDRSFEEAKPLPAEVIKGLAVRGLTQWIPPDARYIPFALALQQAGARVVFMEGNAFNGPAGEVPDGLHQLPADFVRDPEQPAQQPHYPCPLLLEGWRQKADSLRAMLKKYKDAGVQVDAAWLDWEIEPYPGKSQWNEARACSRCRAQFPPGVLDDFQRYRAFITRWRQSLFSTYVVAPFLEAYPTCSVTNWEVVISSPETPTPNWSGLRDIPPVSLGMFNTANPVVYGNTLWCKYHWQEAWQWPLDVPHMDRVYTAVMLGEISAHCANALRSAPDSRSVPWVDRFCADDRDPKIPILSRVRYREILRHCWLRGTDSMQIFNPNWFPTDPTYQAIVTEEVEDVVQVYDEMLAYRPILERGQVMNTAAPGITDNGPIWSGRRLGDTVLLRAFTQATRAVQVTITPFSDADPVTLSCPPNGATYLLTRQDKRVKVERK